MRRLHALALVAAGLVLMAAPVFAGMTIVNPSFEATNSVADEVIDFALGNTRPFAYTPVIPATVTVTSLDGTITYAHNTDWVMHTGQTIERKTSGAIPAGKVKVSYQYSVWDGWTRYGYTVAGEGGVAENPWIGSTGGESLFDVLYPNQGTIDGYVCCGFQGWTTARNGGVYQTITTDSAGYIVCKARSFSLNPNTFAAWDNGTRVRARLLPGPAPTPFARPADDQGTWSTVGWGSAWSNLVVQVPGPGTYTLYIENHTPWSNGIYSSLWDWVRWSDGVVTITDGPYITDITETSATITWDTDVLSNTKLDWDTNGAPYDNHIVLDPGTDENHPYKTHHVVQLTNLTPGQQYYVQCISESPGLTEGQSGEMVFATVSPVQPVLTNFDFEATDGSGAPTLVPWTTFGNFDGIYPTPVNGNTYGVPPHSPDHFAGAIESYNAVKDGAGIFQRVSVTPGKAYAASVYIFTENVRDDNGTLVPGPGYDAQCRIGIDPTGGTDPSGASVVWSAWDNSQDWQPPYSQLGYKKIAVLAETGTSNIATVFLQVRHPFANAWVKTAFDDVELVEAQPCSDLSCVMKQPIGWMVNADNGGAGYLVTKVEDMLESTGLFTYFWIQSDDRTAAFKVRTTIDTVITGGNGVVERGCRVGIVGRSASNAITEFDWADPEIQVSRVDIKSTGNADPGALGVTGKSLCGGPTGIKRGALGGVGLNNSGLLVRMSGWVSYSGGSTYSVPWFLLDDGSGLIDPQPVDLGGGQMVSYPGVRVFMPSMWSTPPPAGAYVTVTGVAYLDVYDPTLGVGDMPNNSGDEVFVRSIRLRDDSTDIQTLINAP